MDKPPCKLQYKRYRVPDCILGMFSNPDYVEAEFLLWIPYVQYVPLYVTL